MSGKGNRRTLYGWAGLIGLAVGLLLVVATASAGDGADEVPGDGDVEPVAQFADSAETITIDAKGEYTWRSDVISGTAARNADAYVVEPRYVDVEVTGEEIRVIEVEGGVQLVFDFKVTSIKGDEGRVVILGAHGDAEVDSATQDSEGAAA